MRREVERMGWLIAILVILAICAIFRGTWRVIFKPIIDWLGDLLKHMFMRGGMSEKGARAAISVAIIIVILLIVWGL